jgi:serine/threonine-protein kinase
VLSPQIYAPIVHSTAVVPTEGSASPRTADGTGAAPTDAKWAMTLGEAQKLFFEGDPPGAQRKLKEAQDQGAAPGIVHAFQDQMATGAAATGPCKMASFSRPRLALPGNGRLPSIAAAGKGTIVTWTDDHEVSGHEHVYEVMTDPMGRATSRPRDLTPEAADVGAGTLLAAGDRTLLLYWDKSGREAGVRVRWIDENGRIGGDSVLVGAGRPGSYWPAIERAPDGFYVAWQDDRDGAGDELFLRHLGPQAEPLGAELRATDYVGKRPPVVRNPSVAIASNALYVTYELDRDPKQHLIQRLRVPLGSPELTTGLEPLKAPRGPRKDRELGDVQVVNEDKAPSNAPDMACGSEGCFLAWNGEQGGAYVALVDPDRGRVMWRKLLAAKGSHPSLSSSSSGQVMVAYFEAGRIRLATLSRDGVGTPSPVAKITGDQPRPSLASARPGEWLVAWQDAEERHSEVYAARVVCK